jgi:glycosyltransferase involved in cell wall biosynthesis
MTGPERRLRVAYLARWDASVESGVLKKIAAQVRLACELGTDARLFLLSPSAETSGVLSGIPLTLVSDGGSLRREVRMAELARAVELWHPDVVYLRYESHFVALEWLADRRPTVMELNTDDVTEYPLYLPWYRRLYHSATRQRLLRRAAGFVGVTRELARRIPPAMVPTTVIANGIDLRAIPEPRAPERRGDDTIRVVFLGAPGSVWHGVDEIIAAARVAPEFRVDLIGWPTTAELPSNVTAHGMLSYGDYAPLLAQADLAIASVGIYRRPGMSEASPLKVREYLAHGLPTIIGYEDTDFPEPVPFLLRIADRPGNVREALPEIRRFALQWRGRRVLRADIRRLDSTEKERQRLEFLRRFRRA